MFDSLFNGAVNAAATSVRSELIRLDFVDGDHEPDEKDKAIALAAVRAFLDYVQTCLGKIVVDV